MTRLQFAVSLLILITMQTGAGISLTQTASIPVTVQPTKVVFSHTYHLIFTISDSGLYIYDASAKRLIERHPAKAGFSDLDLTPDGRYLFVADYGGTEMGYGTPLSTHYVHRYDLLKGKWVVLAAPKVAWRIEAVSSNRVLLQEEDQWIDITVNSFSDSANGRMVELHRTFCDYYGDMEYDPLIGRVYHGNSGSSSSEIHVLQLTGDNLTIAGETGTYGTAQNGGGTSVLSLSGKYFFFGSLQVDAYHITTNLHTFPDAICAANDFLACSRTSYYDIKTGALLGSLPVSTGTGSSYYYSSAMAFSEDGTLLCAYDSETKSLKIFRQNLPTPVKLSYEQNSPFSTRAGNGSPVCFDLLGRTIREYGNYQNTKLSVQIINTGSVQATGIHIENR